MSASNGGLMVNGQERDLVMQAAMAYDETQKRIANLENQLNRAVAALEAKNAEIDNLTPEQFAANRKQLDEVIAQFRGQSNRGQPRKAG